MTGHSYRTPRKKLRLEGYDYSQEGLYLVTICTLNRDPLFLSGDVIGMIDKFWKKIPEKYLGVILDDYVIMPNHVHGIILIVGADPCVGPYFQCEKLPRVMQWFKTMTTNAYIAGIKKSGWRSFVGKLWQRSYHEVIVRNEGELDAMRTYIRENPVNWETDFDNPLNIAQLG